MAIQINECLAVCLSMLIKAVSILTLRPRQTIKRLNQTQLPKNRQNGLLGNQTG